MLERFPCKKKTLCQVSADGTPGPFYNPGCGACSSYEPTEPDKLLGDPDTDNACHRPCAAAGDHGAGCAACQEDAMAGADKFTWSETYEDARTEDSERRGREADEKKGAGRC